MPWSCVWASNPWRGLIADRPALRAAVLVEYRRQSAGRRQRLLDDEGRP